jgi:hypothetical protein
MSEDRVTMTRKTSFIDEGLRMLMRELSRPEPIEGSVTVDGHEYWWYLEYGTGVFHEAEEGMAPAGLDRPTGVKAESAADGEYTITADTRPYMRFYWERVHRMVTFKKPAVIHQLGIAPTRPGGFVRNAIFDGQMAMHNDLQNLFAQGITKITRKKLVEIVNRRLTQTLKAIRRNTPVGSPIVDESPGPDGHLRDAWGIQPASE